MGIKTDSEVPRNGDELRAYSQFTWNWNQFSPPWNGNKRTYSPVVGMGISSPNTRWPTMWKNQVEGSEIDQRSTAFLCHLWTKGLLSCPERNAGGLGRSGTRRISFEVLLRKNEGGAAKSEPWSERGCSEWAKEGIFNSKWGWGVIWERVRGRGGEIGTYLEKNRTTQAKMLTKWSRFPSVCLSPIRRNRTVGTGSILV